VARVVTVGALASGRGTNLQAIIDAAAAGRIAARVAVVISDRRDAGALERARRAGIPALHVARRDFLGRDQFEARIVSELVARGVELVALAGYMRVVGPALIGAFRGRIMNIHPALLPAFPGLEAQRQAWEHGVKVAGCTVHFVDSGMDTGPIIIQAAVPVREDDSAEDLAARILEQEHRIYPEAIGLYAAGRLRVEGRRVRVLGG
jgi:phosphoribosylglycinamide formyltransferase-1